MRIVFLSQYFMPEAGATSELLSGIAMELAREGVEVSAVAGQPSYFGARKVSKVFECRGVKVHRVWSTQFDKNTAFGRVLNSATFAMSVLLALFRLRQDSVIVAVTNPPLLPWICFAAHKLARRKYVLLIHDIYPDIAVALGALAAHGWLTRLWRFFNSLAYKSAERIVVLGRDMREVIARSVDDDTRSRVRIIPNWADKTAIVPTDRALHPFFDELGARYRFVVQYSGNIGRFHEIETILDAAKRLDDDMFLFVFYGEGKQVEPVRRAVAASRGDTLRLMPFQPRERLGLTLTGCDAGLVTLKDGLSGLATPSKLYGVLAAGRPVVVIGPEDCEAAQVVRAAQCGVVVRPGDGAGLVQALQSLRDDPALCVEFGMRARRAFEECYDLRDVARLWVALCEELAGSTQIKSTQINKQKAFE